MYQREPGQRSDRTVIGLLTAGRTLGLVVKENAFSGAVEIFVLIATKAPQKAAEADQSEGETGRDQDRERAHAGISSGATLRCRRSAAAPVTFSRKALATTSNDESDIATAATSGVTNPATATGTAMQL